METNTNLWTARKLDIDGAVWALCYDGVIVCHGLSMGEADRRAHKMNTAEVTAARLARTERHAD